MMILVYIICKDQKEAKKIGFYLVKKKLAACCNFFSINSIYRWPSSATASADKRGKIVKDKEVVLIAKTKKGNFKKVEEEIKKLHSYKIPCVLEIPVSRGNKGYLDWINKESNART